MQHVLGHHGAQQRTSSVIRLAPIACACAVGAAGLLLRNHNPATESFIPCPLYVSTGIYCPGCGLTRAAFALMHGNIAQAFGYNMLFPLFAVAIAVGWWAWIRKAFGRQPIQWLIRLPTWLPIAAGAVLLTFAVLRNVPALDALAP